MNSILYLDLFHPEAYDRIFFFFSFYMKILREESFQFVTPMWNLSAVIKATDSYISLDFGLQSMGT
jgi:hypothetical protein